MGTIKILAVCVCVLYMIIGALMHMRKGEYGRWLTMASMPISYIIGYIASLVATTQNLNETNVHITVQMVVFVILVIIARIRFLKEVNNLGENKIAQDMIEKIEEITKAMQKSNEKKV